MVKQNKIFVHVLILFLLTSLAGSKILAQSSQKRIVINCPIMFDGTLANYTDSLIVLGYTPDSSYISGASNCDSGKTEIQFQSYTSVNLPDANLSFTYFNKTNNCKSKKTNYSVNTSLSDSNTIYIDSFEVASYYAYFPVQNICRNQSQKITINTDLPDGSYKLIFPDGLSTNSGGDILLSESISGIYPISISTEYCLQEEADSSLLLIINEPVDLNMPDTIKLCSGPQNLMDSFTGYLFFMSDSLYDSSDKTIYNSGNYFIKDNTWGTCTNTDSAYVELITPPEITISQTETCDNITLSIDNSDGWAVENTWSTGSKSQTIQVTGNETIFVQQVDENGCVSYDSVFVSFNPLEIEAVSIEKEEADCWKDGVIALSEVKLNNNRGDYNYRLVNTLNGIYVNNLDDVPEGIYKLEFSDSRYCPKQYNEEITIKQKCLEDYPAFSPNSDGIEDSYFIPYEGTVKIFDRNGALIKELSAPAYWDGTNSDGNPVVMGNYVIITDKQRVVNITVIR